MTICCRGCISGFPGDPETVSLPPHGGIAAAMTRGDISVAGVGRRICSWCCTKIATQAQPSQTTPAGDSTSVEGCQRCIAPFPGHHGSARPWLSRRRSPTASIFAEGDVRGADSASLKGMIRSVNARTDGHHAVVAPRLSKRSSVVFETSVLGAIWCWRGSLPTATPKVHDVFHRLRIAVVRGRIVGAEIERVCC